MSKLVEYDEENRAGLTRVVYSKRGQSVGFSQYEKQEIRIRVVPGDLADAPVRESWTRFLQVFEAEPGVSVAVDADIPADSVLELLADRLTDEAQNKNPEKLCAEVLGGPVLRPTGGRSPWFGGAPPRDKAAARTPLKDGGQFQRPQKRWWRFWR
jgi:hypothetical protein